MIKQNFDSTLLNGILGLSCIENYILYALAEHGYNYTFLYGKSYVPFNTVAFDFLYKNAAYASYDSIERLQKSVKDMGVIISEYNFAPESIPDTDSSEYLAVSVSSDYITQKYGSKLWRDDHFILLKGSGENEYFYLNDIPRDCGTIKKDIVKSIYTGTYFRYSIISPEKDGHEYIFTDIAEKIKNENRLTDDLPDILNAEILRDIIGILKISRKRIYEYCSNKLDVSFMNEYLRYLEKTYNSVEYMRVRNEKRTVAENRFFDRLKDIFYAVRDNDRAAADSLLKILQI